MVHSPGPDRTPTTPSSPSQRRRSTNTRTAGLSFGRLTFHCELNNFQNAQELSLVWTGTFVTRGKTFQLHQFSGVLPILVLMKLKSARPATPLGPGLPDTIALPFYAYTYATHQERKIDLSESRELSLKWCEMNDHQSIHPRLLRPTPYFKLRVDSLFHSSCVPPLHYVHLLHYPSLPTSVLKVQSTHSVRQDYQSHICVMLLVGFIHWWFAVGCIMCVNSSTPEQVEWC